LLLVVLELENLILSSLILHSSLFLLQLTQWDESYWTEAHEPRTPFKLK
jgi:hypothetical protein